MANPITWRNVSGPDVADVLDFSTRSIDRGLGGLSTRFAEQAGKMDTDQLNNALNQVEQLTKMGSAREAQRNGFLSDLALKNPAMTRQVRDALEGQANTNKTVFDRGVEEDDKFTLNAVEELIANGQFDLAEETARDLTFGGGRAVSGVKSAQNAQQVKDAEKQYTSNLMNNVQQRQQGITKNNALSQDFLSQMPERDRDAFTVDPTTGILIANPEASKAVQDFYAPSYAQLKEMPFSQIKTREQIQQEAAGQLSSVLGLGKAAELTQAGNTILDSDYVANREQAQDRAALDAKLAEEQAQLGYIIEDNPYTPPIPVEDQKSIGEITMGYLQRSIDNNAWLSIGDGDFEEFNKVVFTAVKNAGGSDISPAAISTALANDPAVLAAALKGDLGDWFNNVNLEKFTDSLKSIDTDFRTITDNRRTKQRAQKEIVRNLEAAGAQQRANSR